VVVSIVNSARAGELDPPSGAVVIADECHRYAATANLRSLSAGYEWRLGLTATLERPDRLESALLDYFGGVCFTLGYQRALADEVVAHFSVALIGVPMSQAEAIEYASLTKEIGKLLAVLIDQHRLPASPAHAFMRIVKEIAEGPWHPARDNSRAFLSRLQQRRLLLSSSDSKHRAAVRLAPAIRVADRTLVFTEYIDSAEEIVQALSRFGLNVATVHSELMTADRRRAFAAFGRGDLDAIVAPRVLDEGVDVPAADLAVIVSASRTKRQMIQRMGRIVRRKADNRLARFAILYLQGTSEDPRCGAHEAFLTEVTSVADDLEDFDLDHLDDALGFLATLEPLTMPRPPRLEDDPGRMRALPRCEDDEIPASDFLGFP
jgi:RNA polymerase primary sigma factor